MPFSRSEAYILKRSSILYSSFNSGNCSTIRATAESKNFRGLYSIPFASRQCFVKHCSSGSSFCFPARARSLGSSKKCTSKSKLLSRSSALSVIEVRLSKSRFRRTSSSQQYGSSLLDGGSCAIICVQNSPQALSVRAPSSVYIGFLVLTAYFKSSLLFIPLILTKYVATDL